MKALKTLLIGALAFVATAASAQVFEAQDGTKYEFQKYWFFDLEGGAQYTLGEAKFRRLIRPNVQIAIGRQFNPVLGLRLQVNGWQSRGYWDLGLLDQNKFAGHYPIGYTFNYVAPGLDLMFDITNLIGGYNPTRVFGLKAFIASVIGGLGSAVAEVVCESAPCIVKRFGVNDRFGQSGTPDALFAEYKLTAEDLANMCVSTISSKG